MLIGSWRARITAWQLAAAASVETTVASMVETYVEASVEASGKVKANGGARARGLTQCFFFR